jgi:hypothetical protein
MQLSLFENLKYGRKTHNNVERFISLMYNCAYVYIYLLIILLISGKTLWKLLCTCPQIQYIYYYVYDPVNLAFVFSFKTFDTGRSIVIAIRTQIMFFRWIALEISAHFLFYQ